MFYDGECGFCDQAVQFVLKHDKKGVFLFAPLQGETALRKGVQQEGLQKDTLVLLEDFDTSDEQKLILGTGAFRVLWLLGGLWTLIGWISFLPGWLYNWGYRLIANNRSKLSCQLPVKRDDPRFLP